MSRFPKRDEYTRWLNAKPIGDLNEALSLLRAQSSSNESHYLSRRANGQEKMRWEIVIPWYAEGDSGGDRSGYDYVQIDQQLAEKLLSEKHVEGLEVKYWGGSFRERDKFTITKTAAESNREFETALLEKAAALLTPGVHTDLAGEARRIGFGREHWRHGRFYVDFRTPSGDRYRVYPEEGTAVVDPGIAAA
jgi:hypothetical protein